jgi:tetratricopeptide (TPR) repeat protein
MNPLSVTNRSQLTRLHLARTQLLAAFQRRLRFSGWLPMALAALGGLTILALAVLAAIILSHALPPGVTVAVAASDWLALLTPLHAQQLERQAGEAWRRSDWALAIQALSELRAAQPGDAELASRQGIAHFLYGQQLQDVGQDRAALSQYDAAMAIIPDQPAVERARRLLAECLQGREELGGGHWTTAIPHLKLVYDLDPQFKDVAHLLYDAHVQLGLHWQGVGQLNEARSEYQAALKVTADGPEAKARLIEVVGLLATPPPVQKRILISISKQKVYVYENNQVIHTWVCSTGEPGRDTRSGHYKVQSKLPMAYASTWDLDMPYWLGVYYAGASENGIHAPPIQRATGQKMWEGLLGSRVSFGCIILSSNNAKTLYNWATVGTPVDIEK